jgi:glycosyltransferase involved in cell wall biosynthesis
MLSVIILTKNEEKLLQACINSIKEIASEVIAVDNGSTDSTLEILKRNNCKIISSDSPSFAVRRNLGKDQSSREWILYIDADERITPELAKEITEIQEDLNSHDAYILKRKDFYFGKERPVYSPMHRLFKKSSLVKWHGDLHETPETTGSTGETHNYAIHLTHTDISSMLTNTAKWSDIEAELRFKNNHPAIVGWRLIRVMATAFYDSFVKQKGYQCGTEGWVEALYQSCSMFLTYAKLWELQNKKEIEKRYLQIDEQFK